MTLSAFTCSQVCQIERSAFQAGLSADVLMERAAQAAFQLIQDKWPEKKQLVLVVGKGNNGGDGCTLAQLAQAAGYQVTAYLASDHDELSESTADLFDSLCATSVSCRSAATFEPIDGAVCVDALLGIGFQGKLSDEFKSIIEAINDSDMPVLSLDVPSGVYADSGGVSASAVKAAVTITYIAHKVGLLTGQALAHVGELVLDTLDVPDECYRGITPAISALDEQVIATALPPRHRESHKGDFGHVLVIGGDYGMGGAVRMAAEAAMRAGAGLVTVATRPEHVTIVSGTRPELMCHAIRDASDCERLLARATVVVIGPGLGQSDWGQSLYSLVLKSSLPKVVDADALTLLANQPMHHDHWILTPHPGEAARLLDCAPTDVQNNRFSAIRSLQSRYGGNVILKGAGTLVCDQEGELALCVNGNSGMSSGGMGDVLSGLLGGLLAQGLTTDQAAQVGVMVHALAADRVANREGQRGLLATDVLDEIRAVVNSRS